MSSSQIILDDGVFYVELNVNYEPSEAPGFLQRRCGYGLTTPGGFECLGSFDKAADGTWKADVNATYDEGMDGDCKVLVRNASRMDAIAALWTGRHTAYSTHH